jgi:hypothetical protein
MLTRSNGAKIIAFAVLIALGIWWLRSYRITDYRGDGRITDSGTWNYPRYRVELSQIPLFESGIHQFRLAGLPSDQMTLELVVVGKTGKDREELTKLRTRIDASLIDDQGHTVCNASGIPSDGIRENAWILRSTDVSAAFYNQSCVDVVIYTFRSYNLEVKLSEIDAVSPRAYLLPIVSGGGNELP